MTPTLPLCPCGHYLAIHGPRGCVAASGCPCRRKGRMR